MRERPTVTARCEYGRINHTDFDRVYTDPGVSVAVEFELGDHEAALARLRRAVAEVEAQLAEASR